MERQRVESTNLRAVGYDAETETLEIEFQNGRIYQYSHVPLEIYTELMSAESPGGYFNEYIRDQYADVRIR